MSTAIPIKPKLKKKLPATRTAASGLVVVPAMAFEQSGFNRWVTSPSFPEEGRISWIDGQLVIELSPEELITHGRLKGEISRTVANLIKSKKLGSFFPDRALLINESAGISTEPDAMFASAQSLRAGHVQFVPNENGFYMSIVGSPDWVLEIVSQTSVEKDTRLLKAAYERAGVKEYWLIDARSKRIDVKVFQLVAGRYKAVSVKNGEWLSPVFETRFSLHRTKDEFGFWDYTLEITDE